MSDQSTLSLSDFKIRLIENYDEYIAVAELQKEVWGQESIEIVPPSILMVNQKIGGLVAGAFTPENELVAFVYGLPGFRSGEEVHWSHMLAVRPPWRGYGLGRVLKEYQKQFVLERNIDIVHWTYDPLESVNAKLNLSRLGALPAEYVLDLYGKGEKSVLHRGIGTDRFILTWFMKDQARMQYLAGYHEPTTLDDAVSVISDDIRFEPASLEAYVIKVEIPENIQQLKDDLPKVAADWRNATRSAFQHYMSLAYAVTAFMKDDQTGRCYYLMSKPR